MLALSLADIRIFVMQGTNRKQLTYEASRRILMFRKRYSNIFMTDGTICRWKSVSMWQADDLANRNNQPSTDGW